MVLAVIILLIIAWTILFGFYIRWAPVIIYIAGVAGILLMPNNVMLGLAIIASCVLVSIPIAIISYRKYEFEKAYRSLRHL